MKFILLFVAFFTAFNRAESDTASIDVPTAYSMLIEISNDGNDMLQSLYTAYTTQIGALLNGAGGGDPTSPVYQCIQANQITVDLMQTNGAASISNVILPQETTLMNIMPGDTDGMDAFVAGLPAVRDSINLIVASANAEADQAWSNAEACIPAA